MSSQPPPYGPNQGYPGQGYPQQPYPQQSYPQHHQMTNTVVVQQPPTHTTTIIKEKRGVNHCLHCIISIFFFPWIFVWMILCCCYGC